MRQYAWYSPELDVLVLQTIMEDCHIAFEWDWSNMSAIASWNVTVEDPMLLTAWMPLGEL